MQGTDSWPSFETRARARSSGRGLQDEFLKFRALGGKKIGKEGRSGMCGDVDEEANELEELLYARFLAHARALLESQGHAKADSPDDPVAYMEKLFSDALSRCVRDGDEAGADKRYVRLFSQPLVFARLAGLLAGHLALDQDPLRKVIEALMQGYAEAQATPADHEHDHDHDHDHDHSHPH
jgi:hypothetical protein